MTLGKKEILHTVSAYIPVSIWELSEAIYLKWYEDCITHFKSPWNLLAPREDNHGIWALKPLVPLAIQTTYIL